MLVIDMYAFHIQALYWRLMVAGRFRRDVPQRKGLWPGNQGLWHRPIRDLLHDQDSPQCDGTPENGEAS